MKIRLLILVSLFAIAACNPDEPVIDPDFILLNHDDENRDAPELPSGTFEGGARFPASQMKDYEDDQLVEVQYYIQERASSGTIRIYSGSNNDNPETLLFEKNVSIGEEAESWNTHTLSNPIVLNGDDLWITYRFTQATNQRTLGCDPGPAVTNGDWLWDANDGSWLPLRQRSTLNINWNIRGVIEPK